MLRPWFLAFLLFLVPGYAAAADAPADPTRLVIATAAGQQLPFKVELALTSAQQIRGLMYRRDLAPDAGMLFVFPDEAIRRFWMKNTLIPLDMLFIDATGRIVNIGANAVPMSLATVSSTAPAKAVLEINGGLAAMLGIQPGDRVLHPAFSPDGAVPAAQ